MRSEILFCALLAGLAASATLPEVTSYTKVSKNGEESKTSQDGPLSWLISALVPNATKKENSEARSAQDITITVSPVYVAPRVPELQKGEAVDFPSTKRYSTLDEEMLTRLDGQTGRQQAQDRFHPPAIFEHVIAHSNSQKQQSSSSSSSSSTSSPSPSSGPTGFAGTGPSYSQPVFPGTYDYKPPDFLDAKPIMSSPPMPMTVDSYPGSMPKAPDSYGPPPDSYGSSSDTYGPSPDYHAHDPELTHELHVSSYGSGPVYGGELPPKPIEYAGHYDHPAFVDDPYIHDHEYPHDIIYDHIPDDHTTTTQPPEMNDERLSKRPYSYYFIGKKLWYLPLYFSIYFIIYIAALVLKSVARHKINFPASLAAVAAANSRSAKYNDGPGWWDVTVKVLEGIETARKKYGTNA